MSDRFVEPAAGWKYLEQHGLDELAMLQRWEAVAGRDGTTERFDLLLPVAQWLDQQIELIGWQAVRELYPWYFDRPNDAAPETVLLDIVQARAEFQEAGRQLTQQLFQAPDSQQALIQSLESMTRRFRVLERQLSELQAPLQAEDSTVALSRVSDLKQLVRSHLAWCYFDLWLLDLRRDSEDELQAAETTLMEVMGVTAADLRGTLPFRWYHSGNPLQRQSLLGLGLVLTARGESAAANNCLATLQQDALPRQASEFVYLQWLAFLRLRDWENALSLQSNFLGSLQNDPEAMQRTILSMLQTLTGRQGQVPAEGYQRDQPPMRELARQLIQQLVRSGRVELATVWEQQWEALEADTIERRVIQLQMAIQELGIAGQNAQQLGGLAKRLKRIADDGQAGIRLWALMQLENVYQAAGEVGEKLLVIEQRFEAETDVQVRQQLAWQLANVAGKEGRIAAASQWYERLLDLDATTQLAQYADLQIRLLQSGIDWKQRLSLLESAMTRPETAEYAERQWLGEVFAAWRAVESTAEQRELGGMLESKIVSQLAPSGDFEFPLDAESMPKAIMLASLWERQIAETQAAETPDDSEKIDRLVRLLDHCQALLNSSAQFGALPGLKEMMLKALPYWDQRKQYDQVLAVRQLMPLESMEDGQAIHLLTYSVRAMIEKRESGSAQTLVLEIGRLLSLMESRENKAEESLWPVRAQYLTALVDAGQLTEAAQWLETLKAGKDAGLSFQQAVGRYYSAAEQWKQAESAWEAVAGQVLGGTDPWFEARYHQLQAMSRRDPAAAQMALQQWKLLYPDVGPRWTAAMEQLERQLSDAGN